MTFRRLAAKIANRAAVAKSASFLSPHQLGVGVQGECEAIVHPVRSFISSCPAGLALLKIDFCNAFNSIRRDSMLEVVEAHVPELLHFLDTAYSEASILQFGEFAVLSEEGVQQGDPLGPLLFCFTVAGLLNDCDVDFVGSYLDAFTLGGSIDTLITQVHSLEVGAGSLGLSLNPSKCEIIGLSNLTRSSWQLSLLGNPEVSPLEASLLGAPLLSEGVEIVLERKQSDFNSFADRLKYLSSYESLFLIKNVLSVPKLLYLLRTSSCFGSRGAIQFDEALRTSLALVTNCLLTDEAWLQATLPVR